MSVKEYIQKHKKAIGILGVLTGAVVGTLAVIFITKKRNENRITRARVTAQTAAATTTKKVPAKKATKQPTKKTSKTPAKAVSKPATKKAAKPATKAAGKQASAKKKTTVKKNTKRR